MGMARKVFRYRQAGIRRLRPYFGEMCVLNQPIPRLSSSLPPPSRKHGFAQELWEKIVRTGKRKNVRSIR